MCVCVCFDSVLRPQQVPGSDAVAVGVPQWAAEHAQDTRGQQPQGTAAAGLSGVVVCLKMWRVHASHFDLTPAFTQQPVDALLIPFHAFHTTLTLLLAESLSSGKQEGCALPSPMLVERVFCARQADGGTGGWRGRVSPFSSPQFK